MALRSSQSDGGLRALGEEDLAAVASIHCAAFPESLLTALGNDVVGRYYHWLLAGPHDSIAVGVEHEGKVVGFCFGGVFRGAMAGFLRRNRWFLLANLVARPWVLLHSVFRKRIVAGFQSGFRGKSRDQARTQPTNPVRSFGILSIAVHPSGARRGIGRLMMGLCEQTALERGFQQMHLTVHPSNDQALRFYEQLGWHRTLEDGAWGGKMVKPL